MKSFVPPSAATFALLLALVALTTIAAGPAEAQSAPELAPQGLKMDRPELEALLQRFEGIAASSSASRSERQQAEREAAIIRERLSSGDFRVGDRIILRVEGESNIPETLPVERGPRITLPVIGPISLHGVLRSELQAHLTRELGHYLQNPVVYAESEVRISILGSVGRPGFYTVPADMLVSELLMHAGGPSGNADLDKLRIERMGEPLWGGNQMRSFLAEGVTLDQLNVRAGDEVVLPARAGASRWWTVTRWGLGVATSIFFGVRAFR